MMMRAIEECRVQFETKEQTMPTPMTGPQPGSKAEQIVNLWNAGKSHAEIAAELGCKIGQSYNTVHFWKKRGIPMRDSERTRAAAAQPAVVPPATVAPQPPEGWTPAVAPARPEAAEALVKLKRIATRQPEPPAQSVSRDAIINRIIEGLCCLQPAHATVLEIAKLQALAELVYSPQEAGAAR